MISSSSKTQLPSLLVDLAQALMTGWCVVVRTILESSERPGSFLRVAKCMRQMLLALSTSSMEKTVPEMLERDPAKHPHGQSNEELGSETLDLRFNINKVVKILELSLHICV